MQFIVSIPNPLNTEEIFLFLYILCSITVSAIVCSELLDMKFRKMAGGVPFSDILRSGIYLRFRNVRLSFFFVTRLRE